MVIEVFQVAGEYWLNEQHKCEDSFTYWLVKYARIIDAPTMDNPGGIIEFELWDHLKQIIHALLTKRLIVCLKTRQVGVSWIVAAYVLWFAMYKSGAMILLFSKGESEAIELLAKCKRIHNNLPELLQLKRNPDSATEMGFPTMLSSIKAFAATETAGVSFTASIMVCDEWDWHPFAEQNYLQAKPTIDAGGQFVGLFTPDSMKPDSLPKSIYRGAKAGTNSFYPIYIPFDARPGRDEAWYRETERNVPIDELRGLSQQLFMNQNYHRNETEALRGAETQAAFNFRVLDEMMGETKNPISIDEEGVDNKVVHVYQHYRIGETYISASDTGHGVGKDYSITVIINVRSGAVVADIMQNNISVEEFAMHSVKLLDLFKNPIWWPEDNEWGRVVISTAQKLGYKNFGYQDKHRTKPGYHTGTNRHEIWGALIPAIDNHQITISNAEGLKQFYDIIRNVDKEGRIEAKANRNDDYPMAVGIAVLKMKDIHLGESIYFQSTDTLTFRPGRRR